MCKGFPLCSVFFPVFFFFLLMKVSTTFEGIESCRNGISALLARFMCVNTGVGLVRAPSEKTVNRDFSGERFVSVYKYNIMNRSRRDGTTFAMNLTYTERAHHIRMYTLCVYYILLGRGVGKVEVMSAN